jgi:hypothetical protein
VTRPVATIASMTTIDPIRSPSSGTRSEAAAPGGWLVFAGTVLGLAGFMRFIDAIWAFTYSGALPDNLDGGVLSSNLTAYAWAWLIVGAVLVIASIMLLVRSQFARWIGVVAAVIQGLSAMTWMPYYPIWALTYVGLAVLTFYALAKYGGRQDA